MLGVTRATVASLPHYLQGFIHPRVAQDLPSTVTTLITGRNPHRTVIIDDYCLSGDFNCLVGGFNMLKKPCEEYESNRSYSQVRESFLAHKL